MRPRPLVYGGDLASISTNDADISANSRHPLGFSEQARGMDLTVWSKSVPLSSSICLDGCSAEFFSVQPDFLLSNPDMTDHSVASNKTSDDNPHPELSSSKEAGHFSAGRHPSPTSSTCGYRDWSFNSGHHAKRARVENIIRGMTSSPAGHVTDAMMDRREQSDGMSERIQELPLHQEGRGSYGASHSQVTKTQLERRQLHLRQLRTNTIVSAGIRNINSSDLAKSSTCISSSETSPRGARTDPYSELERSSSRKTQACKLINQSKPEQVKLMAEVLKYELSRAVSRSVDSIFRSMPLLQTPSDDDSSPQSAVCKDSEMCYGSAKTQVEDAQSEALSLVVQKPHLKRGNGKDLYCPKPPVSFSCNFTLQEGEPSQEAHTTAGQNAIRCFDVGQSKLDMFDACWSSVKVRSKVNSRLARSLPVDVLPLRSPCLPLVKIESDDLMKTNIYMADEGLTTSHLKKAKLMFFYTRYPSSQTLKMCFHDVQFTRCITSQLIKWFSNFREFYYIQMEKFARHALMHGVTDVGCLAVGRESELFRALSMHYNKASDFQIPDRFLEVAEITLREFYVAISLGKDRDPSWKKAIYKVICKLDSDVPAEFKNIHSR